MAVVQLGVVIAVGLATTPAVAEHGDGMVMSGAPDLPFGAGVSLVAARYSTPLFVGDYEGVAPTAAWMRGPWSAMATVVLYRLEENGRTVYGPGDAMVSGTAIVLATQRWRSGVTIAATLPTGDQPTGLGMGHVMVMPSVWLARDVGSLALRATVGYDRALTGLAGHDHGLWPIVDPMNLQEIGWGTSATLPVWHQLQVAAVAGGGVPIGVAMGVERVAAGLQATWVEARLLTSFELQVGVLGDPYVVRGILATTVRL